jgi:hypothetical protein
MKIRAATQDDIPWLLAQLRIFAKFYGTQKSLFGTQQSAAQVMASMIERHVVFIADKPNVGPVGFIAGYLIAHPYNPELTLLSETFWWVQEEHRRSRAGLMLLDKFTDYGAENADWITFALESHSPVNDKCLTKRGFKIQERSFLKEII